MKERQDSQRLHWEKTFALYPHLYGPRPSYPARKAVRLFRREKANEILELGGGQGRDSIFFAKNGFKITTVEYTREGANVIRKRGQQARLKSLRVIEQDVRKPLPFDDNSFDACYSHMLYCMALRTRELESLSKEVRRILRPGGLSIFTARNTRDKHYGKGIDRGDDMYEVDGFVVHFFSLELVEHLAVGYSMIDVEEFQEGPLPRNLFLVTLRRT